MFISQYLKHERQRDVVGIAFKLTWVLIDSALTNVGPLTSHQIPLRPCLHL